MDLTLPVKSHKNEMLLAKLRSYDACAPACNWIHQNGFESLQEAWDACSRADWMEWLLLAVEKDGSTPASLLSAQVEIIRYCWKQVFPQEDSTPWIDQALSYREVWAPPDTFYQQLVTFFAVNSQPMTDTQYRLAYTIDSLANKHGHTLIAKVFDGFSSDSDRQTMVDIVRKHFPTAPTL